MGLVLVLLQVVLRDGRERAAVVGPGLSCCCAPRRASISRRYRWLAGSGRELLPASQPTTISSRRPPSHARRRRLENARRGSALPAVPVPRLPQALYEVRRAAVLRRASRPSEADQPPSLAPPPPRLAGRRTSTATPPCMRRPTTASSATSAPSSLPGPTSAGGTSRQSTPTSPRRPSTARRRHPPAEEGQVRPARAGPRPCARPSRSRPDHRQQQRRRPHSPSSRPSSRSCSRPCQTTPSWTSLAPTARGLHLIWAPACRYPLGRSPRPA